MENGHAGSPTDSDDSVEFRILMAYTQRRRPQKEEPTDRLAEETPPAPTLTVNKVAKEEKQEGKRKKKRSWKKLFSCITPQAEEKPLPTTPTDTPKGPTQPDPERETMFRGARIGSQTSVVPVEAEGEISKVVGRVIGIADELQLMSQDGLESPKSIEADGHDEDEELEKMIGVLLRDVGDRINEEFEAARLGTDLLLNYSFFRRLMNRFLETIGYRSRNPEDLRPQASNKTQIAVTCEVTSRLSALKTLPENRLLNVSARYLQEYYSSWAQQQGGYEAVFLNDEEEDVD